MHGNDSLADVLALKFPPVAFYSLHVVKDDRKERSSAANEDLPSTGRMDAFNSADLKRINNYTKLWMPDYFKYSWSSETCLVSDQFFFLFLFAKANSHQNDILNT